VAGSHLTTYLLPDEAIAFERYRREVIGSAGPLAAEFTMIDARGCRREMRVDAVRMDAEGREWRAAPRGQTVPNMAIRRRGQAGRLEALGEHASGIGHDLDNLLRGMSGRLDVALQSVTETDGAYHPLAEVRNILSSCTIAIQQLAVPAAET